MGVLFSSARAFLGGRSGVGGCACIPSLLQVEWGWRSRRFGNAGKGESRLDGGREQAALLMKSEASVG